MTLRQDAALQFPNRKGIGIDDSTGNAVPAGGDLMSSLGLPGAAATALRFLEVVLKTLHAQSDAGVRARLVIMEEEITLSTSGLTTDSTADLLLAGAIVLPLHSEVTTTITTTTDWAVGVSGTAAKFQAATTDLTAGTKKLGAAHWAGTVAIFNAAAGKVRITCTVANPGAGKVRVSVPQIVIEKAA